MRTHDEHTPHASRSFGVRQFNERATSSAKRFLPTPSSPANSSAPGRRSDTSIRLSASLARVLPVSSLNIHFVRCQITSTTQKRDEDLPDSIMRLFNWTTGVDHLYPLRFGGGEFEISVAYARVKLSGFDIESIAHASA